MNPALSILFFTSLSGAGLGLLFLLSLSLAWPLLSPAKAFHLYAFAFSFLLITIGLIASVFHLGKPERAWRAFSQWRSSWLSREAILALLSTMGLAALSACIYFDQNSVAVRAIAFATATLALMTLCATAKIYSTLKPIPAWHHPLVLPSYVALSISSGTIWFFAFLKTAEPFMIVIWPGMFLLGSVLATALLKWLYWRSIRRQKMPVTAEQLTGLGRLGQVKTIDPPHTESNYLLHEMGYQVARKKTTQLRALCYSSFFIALFITAINGYLPAFADYATWLIAALYQVGFFVERWLFFAEAKHVVIQYYKQSS